MFWNDPNLYGATFKDIGKEPFLPWMNVPWNLPKFVPPTYGYLPPNPMHAFNPMPELPRFVPPTYGYFPPTPIHAFNPTPELPRFVPPTYGYLPPNPIHAFNPMIHPYLPPTSFSPLTLPYGLNPPFYGFYRPFTF